MRGRSTVRQQDVTRAVKGAVAAGMPVAAIEVSKDGKIVIISALPRKSPDQPSAMSTEWDDAT